MIKSVIKTGSRDVNSDNISILVETVGRQIVEIDGHINNSTNFVHIHDSNDLLKLTGLNEDDLVRAIENRWVAIN